MTSPSEARDAESFALQQRISAAKLAQVDPAKGTQADIQLCERVKAAAESGGPEFDRAMSDAAVNRLVMRGVLRFGGAG